MMSSKDTAVEAAIKNIDRQFKDAKIFQRIARAVKPRNSAPLTKVESVTTTSHLHPVTGKVIGNSTIKIVDTQKALEESIIPQNKEHFAQADGTPFTRPPLTHIGSANGYTNVFTDAAGKEIRLPDTTFIETSTVLEIIRERQREPGPEWSEIVSFDDFISGLLHWREQMSTSPSGRHLGLYRALATAHCNSSGECCDFDDDDSNLTTKDMAEEQILELIHGLASAAARRGFYL
jgi:hypothetical protein